MFKILWIIVENTTGDTERFAVNRISQNEMSLNGSGETLELARQIAERFAAL